MCAMSFAPLRLDELDEVMEVEMPPPPPPVTRVSPDPMARAARLRGFMEATHQIHMDNIEQSFSRFHCQHGEGSYGHGQ